MASVASQTTNPASEDPFTKSQAANGTGSSKVAPVNGTHANGLSPKITLYTNHGCPWAHRAHITLKELGLPYDEVIIDLEKPREEWYLKVNPVGTAKPNTLIDPGRFGSGPEIRHCITAYTNLSVAWFPRSSTTMACSPK